MFCMNASDNKWESVQEEPKKSLDQDENSYIQIDWLLVLRLDAKILCNLKFAAKVSHGESYFVFIIITHGKY